MMASMRILKPWSPARVFPLREFPVEKVDFGSLAI
jgi:hypothetical protein